ncbi:MAG: T9SS type A sorting domain-containing protein [Bacteroidia bacterium]
MNNDDRLKNLVDAAKNEKPLFSITEVENVLDQNTRSKTLPKHTKLIALMSLIIIISSLIFFQLNAPKNQKTNLPNKTTETFTQKTPINDHNSSLIKPQIINSDTTSLAAKRLNKDTAKTRVVYYVKPYNPEPKKPFIYNETSDKSPNQKPLLNNYFPEITEEDWTQLNMTIGKRKLEYNIEDPTDSASHYVMFTYNYADYKSSKTGSFSSTEDERLLPLGVSHNNGSRFLNFRTDASKVMDSFRNEQLIVGIKTPMANHLVVWYKINNDLTQALPNNVAYKLKNNKLQYNCSFSHGKLLKPGDAAIVKKPRLIGSKQYEIKVLETPYIDSSLITNDISYDANTVINASKFQLHELGVDIEGAEMKLSGKIFSGTVEFKVANGRSFNSRRGMTPNGSSKDILPIYVSGKRISDQIHSIYPSFYFGIHPYQHFLTKRQNYLPLEVKIPFNDSTLVLWYEPSFALFEKLGYEPTKQRELMQKFVISEYNTSSTQLHNSEFNFNSENEHLANQGIKLLELDKATLANLKIFTEDEKIHYFENKYKYTFHQDGATFTIHSSNISNPESLGGKNNEHSIIVNFTGPVSFTKDTNVFRPKYITDDLAQVWRTASSPEGVDIKTPNRIAIIDSLIKVDITKNYLIPVLVKTGANYTVLDKTLGRFRPDCIFWYEPTEEFLRHLPDSIANGIRAEIEHMVYTELVYKAKADGKLAEKVALEKSKIENKATEQCTYFEACMDQTLAVSDFKIYPNPVKELLFVNVESSESCQGELIITDIKGRQLANTKIEITKGTNSYSIPVNELNEGIFLITLSTNKGDLKMQRLIKVR